MPKVTDIRNAITSELEVLVPDIALDVIASIDERAQYCKELPILRVARGDSEITTGSINEWENILELTVSYVDLIDSDVDERIDAALEKITQSVTRSEALASLIDFVEPSNISIDNVESEDPMIAATITFNIHYSEGV